MRCHILPAWWRVVLLKKLLRRRFNRLNILVRCRLDRHARRTHKSLRSILQIMVTYTLEKHVFKLQMCVYKNIIQLNVHRQRRTRVFSGGLRSSVSDSAVSHSTWYSLAISFRTFSFTSRLHQHGFLQRVSQ